MINLFLALSLAKIAERYPVSYFDIGARGGFQSNLHPIAFAVDAVGFEPNSVEFGKLKTQASDPWKSVTMLPYGVSGETGSQTLYVPTDPEAASLLKHNSAIGNKFDKPQFFEIEHTEEIDTLSLGDALTNSDLQTVDYLKIDIEGAELAVLQSSPSVVAETLAIKTEVAFMEFRQGQPLAGDVDAFLRRSGFELMDILSPAHWRRHGYVVDPFYSAETPPYSRGQIVQSDYLFFRDPDTLDDHVPQLLKLSMISLALGYFDHALMILERPAVSEAVQREFGVTAMEIVAPASKLYGRKAFVRNLSEHARRLVPFIRYLRNLRR